MTYEILTTSAADLPQIFQLFDLSVEYQKRNGYPDWANYDRKAIIRDHENGNQYKVVVDGQIAIVFSACYTDKLIWREMDKGDSVYLHRIVGNQAFKGQKLFGVILEWTIRLIRQKNLKTIRMDTWAANPKIIEYYKEFGFKIVENYITPNIPELPVHNRNLVLTLLEYGD